jgi:hypothetical protein
MVADTFPDHFWRSHDETTANQEIAKSPRKRTAHHVIMQFPMSPHFSKKPYTIFCLNAVILTVKNTPKTAEQDEYLEIIVTIRDCYESDIMPGEESRLFSFVDIACKTFPNNFLSLNAGSVNPCLTFFLRESISVNTGSVNLCVPFIRN